MLPLTRDRNGGWKSVACAHSAILIAVLLDVFGFLSQCSNKVYRENGESYWTRRSKVVDLKL